MHMKISKKKNTKPLSTSLARTENSNKHTKRQKMIKHRKLSGGSHDELILRVKQRYGLRSTKTKDELKEAIIDNNGRIKNPIGYERIMARTFEAHLNRILQPETPEDLLPSNWVCAICFQPPANFDLTGDIQIASNSSKSRGELFGPYFVQLSQNFQPPEILVPRQMLEQYNLQNLNTQINDEKFSNDTCFNNYIMASKRVIGKRVNRKKNGNLNKFTLCGKLDLWFHGECALEVPDLYLIGGRFPNLELQIAKYWESIGVKTNSCLSL